MTTDLLEHDTDTPDLWEPTPDDEAETYRCNCPDCRALRGPAPRDTREPRHA
jgi:hypothetical protein